MIVAMATKFKIEKFNGNNFLLWKLKMKAIIRKDKCLAVIGERPVEVTDDTHFLELYNKPQECAKILLQSLPDSYDQVIIHLTSNVLSNNLLFDDVVAAILEEENRRNNREDRQTSSRQVDALVVTRGRKDCRGLNTSYPQGNVASTSEDGNALCCEAAVANESRKRFADYGGSVYSCNDHELKIIGIRSIMVKMHDGTVEIQNKNMKIIKGALVHMKGEKVAANLYQLKGEIMEEAEASVASHSPSHRVAITWHQKLGHMSEQGMKILVERKLLPGLTKVSLPFCEHCVISKQHRLKFKTSNSRSVYVLELVHSDVWKAPVLSLGGPKQEGIKRQFTTPYTPQQNRVAEWMNRTLLERARSMLATASLGKSFWAEAVNTALKGYRLWDPTAHKVIISRDVVFMEDKIQENEEGWQSDYVIGSNIAYCLLTEEGETSTLQEALNNLDASFWKEAMQEEIAALHKNKTWELVPLLGGRKPIGNKWVYKIKRNGDDQVERYRARLVVKGYAQKERIDFNELFTTVVVIYI
ncbi:retrovirus-related pol polyprotein from transposon TNT 1-94 [Tanacetum coccineum]